MKKMTKGAIVTGLGVALLIGGGGTLAVWNTSADSNAGTIAAGDLDLQPASTGQWKSSLKPAENIPSISSYRIVPGETLTYTQPLNVTLDGDHLEALLTVTENGKNVNFASKNVKVATTLSTSSGEILPSTVLDENNNGDIVTASTTFAFDAENRESTNATFDFSKISYKLAQQNPNG